MNLMKQATWRPVAAAIAVFGLALSACSTNAAGSGGDDYPSDDIELFLGYDTGGSADPLAREYGRLLGEELGVNVQVQNRPGGSGAVATTEVLGSDADGYTIAVAPSSQLTMTPILSSDAVSYSGPDDWTTVGGMLEQQNGLMVLADSGWATLEDFIAAAKASPGELSVGVSSATGANAMGMASLMELAGIDVKLVPFEGGAGEAAAALLGGHINAMNGTLSGQLGLIQAGDVISLGHSGDLPYEPAESQTFAEQGYDVTSLGETTYYVYAPPELPDDVFQALTDAHEAVVNSDEFAEFLETNGYAPHFTSPDEAADELRAAAEDAQEGVELLTNAGLDLG